MVDWKFVRTPDGSIIISFNEYENRHEIAEQIEKQILGWKEKAEKFDKKIQFWIDQGLSKEKAVIFTYDLDDAYLKEYFELEQKNKKLKDEVRRLQELVRTIEEND